MGLMLLGLILMIAGVIIAYACMYYDKPIGMIIGIVILLVGFFIWYKEMKPPDPVDPNRIGVLLINTKPQGGI